MNRYLHIICFTVPYPANYGGVFDLYFKIKALHEAGMLIYLHCFTTGAAASELNEYCERVFYYPRKTGIRGMSYPLPYIVSSRMSKELVVRLNMDDHPILAEGVHSTGFLIDPQFIDRKIALRLHNTEYIYYQNLYLTSRVFIKKIYYRIESKLLERYEGTIARKVDKVFAVSRQDMDHYKSMASETDVELLPVFTGFKLDIMEGTGCYCLYHGNLSVAENENAVMWLLENVFSTLDIPFIVAGRKPSAFLRAAMKRHSNVTLVEDPSEETLADLLRRAQCHVLPSSNATGIKLKLVHALYSGRYCIVNTAAVAGSDLASLCEVADDAESFRNILSELFFQPFTSGLIEKRKCALERIFDISEQTSQLIRWIS